MGVAEPVAVETSTVALLFSDIEGSTRLLQDLGAGYAEVLLRHRELMRNAFDAHDGQEQGTEGDSFFVTFPTASDATAAALAGQRSLNAHQWPEGITLRVRIGIHVGTISTVGGAMVGMAIHEAARIGAAAHGGQVLVSGRASELCDTLPDGARWRELGAHRLKDIGAPVQLFQLDHDDLPRDFPPPRSQGTSRNNLPAQTSAFIGRDAEVNEVNDLLAATRLLTLTGAGGAGKSRLALRVAADQGGSFADGVWFIDLAPLTDPAAVPNQVVSALGLPEADAADVANAIGGRSVLLLIDNCEHLVVAVADLVEEVLQRCANAQVLATSREPIGVNGEVAWRVPSLGEADAVAFFCARARAVNPRFVVTDSNRVAVAELCERLDAIPLALELAAGRLGSLSVEQLAERLDQRFRLLAGGGRGAMARQRTLQATVDWSYELLDSPSQAVLRRLGVFTGGFSLEAAEVVCVDAATGIDALDVFDWVDSLVAKSLVVAEERDGAVRFRLLETIRQYALDRLIQAGEIHAARDAHAAWVCGLVAGLHAPLWENGEHEVDALQQLDLEAANVRSAFDWLVDADKLDEAATLNIELVAWMLARGRPREGLERAERLLAVASAPPVRALATYVEFTAVSNTDGFGDGDRFERMRADAIALHETAYARFALALDSSIAAVRAIRGDLVPADAVAMIERNVQDATGSAMLHGMTLQTLAVARQIAGDLVGAFEAAMASVSVATTARLSLGESRSCITAARIAFLMRDLDAAASLAEQALVAARRTDDAVAVLAASQALATERGARDDATAARDLLVGALEPANEALSGARLAIFLNELAWWTLLCGDPATAEIHIDRALKAWPASHDVAVGVVHTAVEIALELKEVDGARARLAYALTGVDLALPGHLIMLSSLLEAFARLRLADGDALTAARALGAADAHRSAGGLPIPAALRRTSDLVAAVRAAAGPAADAARAEGATLGAEAALALIQP